LINNSNLEKVDPSKNPECKVSDCSLKSFQKKTVVNFVQVGT